MAAQNYYFLGKYNEKGELIADFDSDITWEEALMLLGRVFIDGGPFYIKNGQSAVLKLENWWYTFAEGIGLINNNKYSVYGIGGYGVMAVQCSLEDKDKKIPATDYLLLVRRALHIPYVLLTEGGYTIRYFADDLLEKMKQYGDLSNTD